MSKKETWVHALDIPNGHLAIEHYALCKRSNPMKCFAQSYLCLLMHCVDSHRHTAESTAMSIVTNSATMFSLLYLDLGH